jgi:hypothetical protein
MAKIKIAITGPSGSGKTMSALRLAKGLGDKFAVVDTENGSASLYSDKFDFDTLNLSPPYTTEKYMAAIDEAVKKGFDTLIIDQISHAWAGEGGLLQLKEMLDSSGKGNSYTNWAKITPLQEQFISKILHSPINLIATLRSKQEYILIENERGKQEPRKVGMAPVQRDGVEYEFTTVFDISMAHTATVSKDRTGLFSSNPFQITEEIGSKIKEWLLTAKPLVKSDNQILIDELIKLDINKRNETLKKIGEFLGINIPASSQDILTAHPAACRSFLKEFFPIKGN